MDEKAAREFVEAMGIDPAELEKEVHAELNRKIEAKTEEFVEAFTSKFDEKPSRRETFLLAGIAGAYALIENQKSDSVTSLFKKKLDKSDNPVAGLLKLFLEKDGG